MSISFLILLPLAMGYLTVYYVERLQANTFFYWMTLPWLPMTFALLGTYLALWEGLICIVMFAPIGYLFSSVGGVTAGFIARANRTAAAKNSLLACIIVLPILVGPIEGTIPTQRDIRSVESEITIAAPAATVWSNIARVPAIQRNELTPSWSRKIGFPDPIEATLSREGVGGVRHATFRGGVLFVETVNVWEPQQRLQFSIRVGNIPPTTLDEHVTVGGKYFDVLQGEYQLEPLADGSTRLHLISHHRLDTDFNWYAHLWTDAVMRDIQRNILRVIKNRCESGFVRPQI